MPTSTSLADRDCSRPNNSIFSRSNALLSQSSGPRSLPRRRSVNSSNSKTLFQPSHSVQNPQFTRKAAQVMLERRRASPVSSAIDTSLEKCSEQSFSTSEQLHHSTDLTSPQTSVPYSSYDHSDSNNHPVPLGEKGQVPCDSSNQQKPKPAVINITVDEGGVHILDAKPKNAARNSSRNKIGRASSRTRQDIRQRLQHPWADDKENGATAHDNLESIFPARRQSTRDWKPIIDGTPGPVSPAVVGNTFARLNEWDGSMPRRHSSRSFIHRRNAPVESKLEASTDLQSKKVTIEDGENGSSSESGQQAKAVDREDEENLAENCDEINKASSAVKKLAGSNIDKENNRDTKMPERGRWCDDCGGVGLIVAALLANREKKEAGGEQSSTDGSPKRGGWRSVVLGDSGRSKLEKEIFELQKENKALYEVIGHLREQFNELCKKQSV